MWIIDLAGYLIGGLFTSFLLGLANKRGKEDGDGFFAVIGVAWPILLLWMIHETSLDLGSFLGNKIDESKKKKPKEDYKDELTKEFERLEELEKCFIVSYEGSEEKRLCNLEHLKNKLPTGFKILHCKEYRKPDGEAGWITTINGPSYYNWTYQKTIEASMAIAIDDAWKFFTRPRITGRKYG